jgi:hypothetical protein
VEFKRCTKPGQVPHGSGPTRGMDIIYVDTPSGDVAEKSSSYNLSIFSSRANSEGAEVVTATREDSSPSIGELWPNIDKLDDPLCKGTSVVHARNALICGKRLAASIGNTSKHSRRKGNKDSLTHITGTSNMRSKRHEGGFAKSGIAWIFSAAPGAISPCMRRSFVDR